MVDKRQAQFIERLDKLYAFIVSYKQENDGIAPTIVEMGEHLGVASTSLVIYYLRRLEGDGRIVMSKGRSRHISIPGGRWSIVEQVSHSLSKG